MVHWTIEETARHRLPGPPPECITPQAATPPTAGMMSGKPAPERGPGSAARSALVTVVFDGGRCLRVVARALSEHFYMSTHREQQLSKRPPPRLPSCLTR